MALLLNLWDAEHRYETTEMIRSEIARGCIRAGTKASRLPFAICVNTLNIHLLHCYAVSRRIIVQRMSDGRVPGVGVESVSCVSK